MEAQLSKFDKAFAITLFTAIMAVVGMVISYVVGLLPSWAISAFGFVPGAFAIGFLCGQRHGIER